MLQIVGDEDIYGVTTIIEPTREVRTYAGTRSSSTVVNVWGWPSVQYVYGPSYSVWVSPWGWHRRPVWYHTWRPVTYVHYYSFWRPYRPYYVTCHTRRVVYAHEIYRPHRRTSVVVQKRYNDRIVRYRSEHRDDYRDGRRSREENRRFVDSDRSGPGSSADRRRDDDNVTRRSSSRESLTSPNRSVIRDRSSATDDRRRSSELRRGDSQDGFVTPHLSRPESSSPSVNTNRSSEDRNVQRPVIRERSAPTTPRTARDIQRNESEIKREAPRPQRSGTVYKAPPQKAPPIRQPAARPSVERSRPAPRPNVQERSVPRERSVAVPDRPTRQATSRPPSVNRSRSSESPAVQHRAPSRPSGATRSSEGRRGRQ